MNKEECFELGILSKLYSFKGEVILFLDSDQPENYYNIGSVFLELNNQLVPFFIEKSQIHKKNQLRIRFETITNEEQAKAIIKKKVFLPLSQLPQLDDDQFYYHEVKGYVLKDEDEEEVGIISNVIENPSNVLLDVNYDNRDVLVPINDATFLKIDKQEKVIWVKISEGLLDL